MSGASASRILRFARAVDNYHDKIEEERDKLKIENKSLKSKIYKKESKMKLEIYKKVKKVKVEESIRLRLVDRLDGRISVYSVNEKGNRIYTLLSFLPNGTISRIPGVGKETGFKLDDGGRIKLEEE